MGLKHGHHLGPHKSTAAVKAAEPEPLPLLDLTEAVLQSPEFPNRRLVILRNGRNVQLRFVAPTLTGGVGSLVDTINLCKFEEFHLRQMAAFLRVTVSEIIATIHRLWPE
jgi:hypothetical protein